MSMSEEHVVETDMEPVVPSEEPILPSEEPILPSESPASEILEVAICRLEISDVREERDAEALCGLIESLRSIGMLSPIIVSREGAGFRVVCGRRRVKAAEALGWETVPAIIWKLDDVRREMAVLSENLHRLELSGAERDTSYLKYVQLYSSLYPNAAQEAEDRRFANLMHDEVKKQEILMRPVVDTPTEAAARAFGVRPPTVSKALKRARAFTGAQRKILEDVAEIPDRQLDLLAAEDADTIEAVVKYIAAGYSFNDSMRQVLEAQGRDYLSQPAAEEPARPPKRPTVPRSGRLDDILKMLPGRRAILDTEAFDGDVELFFKLARQVEVFKQQVDWEQVEAKHGQGPHGLYYRRLKLALGAPHPKTWSACGCQFNPDRNGSSNCPTCRGGGYQIGG